MDIHNISFRTIVSATESEDRVKSALSLFIFDNEIYLNNTEGHFGNPISIMEAKIRGKKCSQFIELLKSNLPSSDILRLKNELDERIDDECNLHIRLDKQAAFQGMLKLATSCDMIVVQIKLKAYPASYENAIAVARNIFEKCVLIEQNLYPV
jgi:RNA binding exosome subunit